MSAFYERVWLLSRFWVLSSLLDFMTAFQKDLVGQKYNIHHPVSTLEKLCQRVRLMNCTSPPPGAFLPPSILKKLSLSLSLPLPPRQELSFTRVIVMEGCLRAAWRERKVRFEAFWLRLWHGVCLQEGKREKRRRKSDNLCWA